ncbi:hypothetical protein [Tessaracoccus massiliensis]|uniref:hypothetical protein n=1 Tax=Tessaracoccus massiliensis TaxID=1522311 RepID=UPI0005911CF2|nr:hypothetical protein [Tessaracoccus massiliensis]
MRKSTLEQLLMGGRDRPTVSILDGTVTSTAPYMVQCTGEDMPGEVIPLMAKGAVGERVAILTAGRRRYALPLSLTWDESTLASISLAKLADGQLSAGVRTSLRTQLAVPTSTEWAAVTPASGITGTAYWRIKNGTVYLHGSVTRAAGNFPAPWTTLLTLPSAACPSLPAGEGLAYKSMSNNAGVHLVGYVGSTGVVAAGAAATNRVDLSTIAPWSV